VHGHVDPKHTKTRKYQCRGHDDQSPSLSGGPPFLHGAIVSRVTGALGVALVHHHPHIKGYRLRRTGAAAKPVTQNRQLERIVPWTRRLSGVSLASSPGDPILGRSSGVLQVMTEDRTAGSVSVSEHTDGADCWVAGVAERVPR
jgi:hypothetical protein